jgi:hypothetical protein
MDNRARIMACSLFNKNSYIGTNQGFKVSASVWIIVNSRTGWLMNGEHSPRFSEGGFLHVARASLEDGLVESGLYRKEAAAMLRTWEKSCFLNEGLGVLYIAGQGSIGFF